MGIEQLVLETKKLEYGSKQYEENIKIIIEHYKPIFLRNVEENYGKNYKEKAEEALLNLVNYYFDKNLEDKISGFLNKRSKTVFFVKTNFDEIIYSENSSLLKKHYINKLYKTLCKKCGIKVLDKKEIKELSKVIIENTFNNYLKRDKKSTVTNYFNIAITRKVNLYQDEEKMLLDYIIKIGVTERIKIYFYSKYMHVFREFEPLSLDYYKIVVNDALETIKSLHFNLECSIRTKLKEKRIKDNPNGIEILREIKAGNYENINKAKAYYSYIIDLVFNKFKDEVVVTEGKLKQTISMEYENYFGIAINKIKKGKDISLPRYVNTRLTDYVKKKKSFYTIYGDKDNPEKFVSYYMVKYASDCPYNYTLERMLKKYNELTDEYNRKERKTSFYDFITKGIREEAKEIAKTYADQDFNEKEIDVVKSMKHPS